MISDFGELSMNYEEGITSRLLSAEEIVRRSKPVDRNKLSGVYFLINNDKIVYVGQSRDVTSRISTHIKNLMPFNRAFYIHCPEEAMDTLESIYIHFLSPPLNGENRNGKSAPKSFESVLQLIHIKVPDNETWDSNEMPEQIDDSSSMVRCIVGLMDLCGMSLQDLSDKSRLNKNDIRRWISGRSSKGRIFREARRVLVKECSEMGFIEDGEFPGCPDKLLNAAKNGAKRSSEGESK